MLAVAQFDLRSWMKSSSWGLNCHLITIKIHKNESSDSEGKCQCQHCDGKQSARACLCDTVGVTSTIDKPELQLGNEKSGNSSQSKQPTQALRL